MKFPSETLFTFGLIGLVLALVVGFMILNARWERKRTEALKGVANDLSFEFFPEGDTRFEQWLQAFHLFTQGHSKKLWNLMRGKASGLQVSIFDYRYVTGSGKHRHTWSLSVFLAVREGMDLPVFTMRPETVWHKIGSWFGYKDINFESHPKFSRTYLLKGPEEDAIRKLFRPEVLDYFDSTAGLNVEGDGEMLIYYVYSRLDPKGVKEFLSKGFEVYRLFDEAHSASAGPDA